MSVTLSWNDGATTELPLPGAWYLKRSLLSQGPLACDGIGTHRFRSGLLALVFVKDGRPGWDHFSVVLIDPEKKAVLDSIDDVGEASDELRYETSGAAISFKVFKSWRRSTGGGEEGVPSWRDVKVKGGRLQLSWRK